VWNILFFRPKKVVTHFQLVGERTIELVRKRIVTYFDNFLIKFKVGEYLRNVKKAINALTNVGF
jgi:hypothetical protein